MNQVILWLQSTKVRLLITVFLVSVTFFVSTAFGYGNSLQARADALTPEATEYQVDSPDSPFQPDAGSINDTNREAGNNFTDSPSEKAKDIADNVREKLNLDQPIYPGTKEFFNQVKEKAGEAVKSPQLTVR